MKHNVGWMGAVALCLSLSAMAQSAPQALLSGDAVVCETPVALGVLHAPIMQDQPGHVVMERVAGQIKIAQLQQKISGALGDEAVQEDQIRALANMNGSLASEVVQQNAERAQAATLEAGMRTFQRVCTNTSQPQYVTLIQRRPISGDAEISMQIDGQPAQVWTVSTYLQAAGESQ